MFEMSLAELEAEVALALPDREVMHAKKRVNVSHNNVSFIFAKQAAIAANVDSDKSTAVAFNSIVVVQKQ